MVEVSFATDNSCEGLEGNEKRNELFENRFNGAHGV